MNITVVKNDPIKFLVLILVFLLPILMAILKHSATAIYIVLVFIGVSLWMSNKKITLDKSEKIILWGFVFAFVIFFLGYLNSDDMWEAWKKLGKVGKFLFVIPVYLALKYCRDSLLLGIKMGLMLSGPVLLGYLLVTGNFRNAPGAYHSIMYGDFSMLIFGTSLLIALLVEDKKLHKFLLVISSLMSLVACFLVAARGAWLALPFLFILLLWSVYKYSHIKKNVLIILLLGMFLTIAVFVTNDTSKQRLVLLGNSITKFFTQENGFNKKTDERAGLWNIAINIWQQNSLIGTGFGDYKKDLTEFIKENPNYSKLRYHGSAHNVFLGWLAQFGVIGFLILLWLVFLQPLLYFSKIEIKPQATQGMGLVGIWVVGSNMIFALTESTMDRSAPVGVFLLFVVIFFALTQNNKNINEVCA